MGKVRAEFSEMRHQSQGAVTCTCLCVHVYTIQGGRGEKTRKRGDGEGKEREKGRESARERDKVMYVKHRRRDTPARGLKEESRPDPESDA
jgi:hypothetical protein